MPDLEKQSIEVTDLDKLAVFSKVKVLADVIMKKLNKMKETNLNNADT